MSSQPGALPSLPPASDFHSLSEEPAAKKQKAAAAPAEPSIAAALAHQLQSPIPPAPQFHLDSASDHRSPTVFDSDLSATPVHLSSTVASLLSSPASTVPAPASVSSVPTAGQSAVEHGVAHMSHDESKQHAQSEQKSAGKSASAMSSAHSSAANSRSHSPVDDGAGKEDPQLMQSTSSAAAAAQPQAKPNNTAKSTDPAGQTIAEAELEGRFKVIRYLGKGSYGTVFVCEEEGTGKQVAIKKIPKVSMAKHKCIRPGATFFSFCSFFVSFFFSLLSLLFLVF